MKAYKLVLLVVSLVGFVGSAWAQQAPSMTPAEIAKIKADVIAVQRLYYDSFSKRDAKTIAEKVYAVPSVSVGPNGVSVTTSTAQLVERFEGSFKALAGTDYGKSEMPAPAVCVINPISAIVSGHFSRYKKDGSIMMEAGETIIFGKFPEGWRIVTLFVQSPKKLVTCAD